MKEISRSLKLRITLECQQMEQKKEMSRHDHKFTSTLRTCQKLDTMDLEKQTAYLKFYCHIRAMNIFYPDLRVGVLSIGLSCNIVTPVILLYTSSFKC